MKLARTFAVVALALAAATPAVAQTTVSGISAAGNPAYTGVYVGPYTANVPYLGGPGTDIICVDYLHQDASNTSWVTEVTPSADFSHTRQGATSNPFERYWKAAFLSTKFDGLTKNSQQWGTLHYAIWRVAWETTTAGVLAGVNALTGRSYTIGATDMGLIDGWVSQANTAWSSEARPDIGSWVVLSDASGASQEYLAPSSVPEPATVLLLLTGFLGIGGVALRRRLV